MSRRRRRQLQVKYLVLFLELHLIPSAVTAEIHRRQHRRQLRLFNTPLNAEQMLFVRLSFLSW